MDLSTRDSGRWSSQDEKVGEVQCCLNASRVHVCTRDGCLSGDNDGVKFSWHEAKAKCEAHGWRLCRRDELERPGSAGCCTQTAGVTDRCGYNKELVWTDDVGGTQTSNIRGRIDSDISMDRVLTVTVDLDRVQIVRGIQIQSGVPDVPYNGPSCFLRPVLFCCFSSTALLSFSFFSIQKPSIRTGAIVSWVLPDGTSTTKRIIANKIVGSIQQRMAPGTGAILCWVLPTILLAMILLAVIYNDPGVPSVFSTNPLCPGATLSNYYTIVDLFWFTLAASLWGIFLAILQLLRPNWLLAALLWGSTLPFGVWWCVSGDLLWGTGMLFLALALPLWFMRLHKIAQNAAAKATADDIKKYDRVWTSARQSSEGRDKMSIDNDLEDIRTACQGKKRDIRTARDRVASSNLFSLFEKFIFWIRAGGLGRYGRTGKVCQATSTNADLLFEEAIVLNDDFFNFFETHINIGELCRGPLKRPDRAFQKVARKYYYNPRHLTDLVRCCILLESITDLRRVLDLIFNMSCVFGDEAFNYALKFVTVKDFDKEHVRTHICEVQLLLRSTYELKIGGCHDNFVTARNMLAQ